jgi:hypothetical protein
MTKKRFAHWLVGLLIFSAVLVVYAGMHTVGSARFGFGSLDASVDIAGFGSDTDTVTVTLSATGSNLVAMCQNKGGNRAPGQNPLNVNVSSSQTVSPGSNGRAGVSFNLNLLPTSAKAAGCPNNNWTVTDLFGTLYVTLSGFNSSNGDSFVHNFVCTVNESQRQVNCTEV